MENIFAFEQLDVYQVARMYVKNVYMLSDRFPQKEDFALTSQIRRAAVSITSNISEGTSRFSIKDKSHFIEIAYGSLMETYSQLQVATDLGYVSQESIAQIAPLVVELRNKLSALRKSYQEKK
ncbi:MAG: four helix bundle protein [Paludibacteraceae bacterium]|nr:four helix bundle protein [Paludibacteraceae bacterium]MBQ6724265.1 four helix bundle protein [Paludibacteraceae bacterium]